MAVQNSGPVESSGTVLNDEDGHILRYELQQQMGSLILERIE